MSDVCTARTLAYSFSAAQGYEEGSLQDRITAAASPVALRKMKDMSRMPMGGSARDWKRQNKKRLQQIKQETRQELYDQFKDEKPCGVFMFLGIWWLLQVVIGAYIGWLVVRWLDERYKPKVEQAMAALA